MYVSTRGIRKWLIFGGSGKLCTKVSGTIRFGDWVIYSNLTRIGQTRLDFFKILQQVTSNKSIRTRILDFPPEQFRTDKLSANLLLGVVANLCFQIRGNHSIIDLLGQVAKFKQRI
jgi:hypothetical protein